LIIKVLGALSPTARPGGNIIAMAGRFVIHIHQGHGPEHYDLMLSRSGRCDEPLATWSLDAPPAAIRPVWGLAGGESQAARKLPDHRPAYLTYEGPVSGGRGCVRRLDAGECEVESAEPDRWTFRLRGELISGRYELVRVSPGGGEDWLLRRISDPPQQGRP